MNYQNLSKLYIVFIFILYACGSTHTPIQSQDSSASKEEIKVGAARTELYISKLKNKNVGLVANQTSVIQNTHLLDTFLASGLTVSKVFSPEHGFRGQADAGEQIKDRKDAKTGTPIISLYGKNKKPSKENLQDIDIMVFDIQDVGVRFYTYISTLHYIMEACAENDIELIVLDRPNPHAHYVDGPMLEEEFKSFVGMHPVPVVYGMTIGEYGLMINGEKWLSDSLKCKMSVVQCFNYNRNEHLNIPIKPSPNLPNDLAIQLYPSLCFFEGTTFSAGRGTPRPFEKYGHPKYQDQTFGFTPTKTAGAKYPKFEDKKCYGKDLSTSSLNEIFNTKRLDLQHLLNAFQQLPNAQTDFFLPNNFFEKLAGTADLRKQILDNNSEEEIRNSWTEDLERFKKMRANYLLYP